MTVTIYSKPACVACNQTYKALDRAGTKYEVIDITADASALEKVKGLGYLQAPVVVVEKEDGMLSHWSGYRPDKIKTEVTV